MAIFKEISGQDITTTTSFLNQVVDVLQEDVSGSTSRRKYQVFVTGGIGPGVTGSLYQTVYDQDFTLSSANPIFDMTFGIYPASGIATGSISGTDTSGKELFPSNTLMMREKLDIYRQFAQVLLGDSTSSFKITNETIDCALFFSIKRLFARDQIKPQTFALRMATTGSSMWKTGSYGGGGDLYAPFTGTDDDGGTLVPTFVSPTFEYVSGSWQSNLDRTGLSNSVKIFSDSSSTTRTFEVGGRVGEIKSSDTSQQNVGLIFYDRGIVVLDMEKVFYGDQQVRGNIDSVNHETGSFELGTDDTDSTDDNPFLAKFIPDFVVSASIDNVVDHIASTRFVESSTVPTALTFQNITNINSTLFFCRAAPDEFNYSGNPTFVDSSYKITTIESGQEDTQRSFTFVTSVGLYDGDDRLLAVAKLSRPVEKSREKDLTFRVRLDF
jgi:hypothetical protein